MLKTLVAGALASALALSAFGSVAVAANRKVDVVNNSGKTIKHFYGSRSGTSSWEEDILGRDTLDPGETFEVNFDDGTGACKFNFKAVFTDGTERVRENIDVCSISTYTYR